MIDDKKLYVPLDEARNEIEKRWNNIELKRKIEDELGENFWSEFKLKPRGFVFKNLISPENGLIFFIQCSKYVNITPLAFECSGDLFVSLNEEKKGMGRLHVQLKNNEKATIDIIDFHNWEKRKFNEILTKTGESLIDFHHKLVDYSGYNIEIKDETSWVKKNGKPSDWYYLYLLHFVAHGVLFEALLADNDEKYEKFFREVVSPSLDRIERNFGLKPLIIKLYPDQQSSEEDFYWWSFPPNVNDYIINYAKENNLAFKKFLL